MQRASAMKTMKKPASSRRVEKTEDTQEVENGTQEVEKAKNEGGEVEKVENESGEPLAKKRWARLVLKSMDVDELPKDEEVDSPSREDPNFRELKHGWTDIQALQWVRQMKLKRQMETSDETSEDTPVKKRRCFEGHHLISGGKPMDI